MRLLFLLLVLGSNSWAMDAEVKISLDPNQLKPALSAFGMKEKDGEEGDIYFFDTQDLMLFKKGIIFRARVRGDRSDVVVKIRPCDDDKLERELDYSATKQVISCTFETSLEKKHMDRVLREKWSIKDLFSKKLIAAANSRVALDWSQLKIRGPIASQKWKRGDLSLELWVHEAGEFLEVSQKVDAQKAPTTLAELTAYAQSKGLSMATGDNKTAWIMKQGPRP